MQMLCDFQLSHEINRDPQCDPVVPVNKVALKQIIGRAPTDVKSAFQRSAAKSKAKKNNSMSHFIALSSDDDAGMASASDDDEMTRIARIASARAAKANAAKASLSNYLLSSSNGNSNANTKSGAQSSITNRRTRESLSTDRRSRARLDEGIDIDRSEDEMSEVMGSDDSLNEFIDNQDTQDEDAPALSQSEESDQHGRQKKKAKSSHKSAHKSSRASAPSSRSRRQTRESTASQSNAQKSKYREVSTDEDDFESEAQASDNADDDDEKQDEQSASHESKSQSRNAKSKSRSNKARFLSENDDEDEYQPQQDSDADDADNVLTPSTGPQSKSASGKPRVRPVKSQVTAAAAAEKPVRRLADESHANMHTSDDEDALAPFGHNRLICLQSSPSQFDRFARLRIKSLRFDPILSALSADYASPTSPHSFRFYPLTSTSIMQSSIANCTATALVIQDSVALARSLSTRLLSAQHMSVHLFAHQSVMQRLRASSQRKLE